ncbi:MarR family winged helix-turn-helix transcriptional regulator [Bradyrhizobium australafricanum]|uniref:MarR family winged helix-turn-helix transcriptional regulator n=1 Tax=Bradyrhizobium australafricanum TaxID=2821406 RepID=UPI001CE26002|nr:MarR family transcriptional regulator [Bradyrhizobium australafricanum]
MRKVYTDCYCTQVRRVSNLFTKIYDEALRPQKLRITQFSTLRELARLGRATVRELADELALDQTTVSRNVKLLIEAGWIDATSCRGDAREKVLKLNKHGRSKLQKAMPAWSRTQETIENHIKGYVKPL